MVIFQSGKCDRLVNAMHITASVFIDDDESGLHDDYDRWLEKLHRMNQSVNTATTTLEKIMRMCT